MVCRDKVWSRSRSVVPLEAYYISHHLSMTHYSMCRDVGFQNIDVVVFGSAVCGLLCISGLVPDGLVEFKLLSLWVGAMVRC